MPHISPSWLERKGGPTRSVGSADQAYSGRCRGWNQHLVGAAVVGSDPLEYAGSSGHFLIDEASWDCRGAGCRFCRANRTPRCSVGSRTAAAGGCRFEKATRASVCEDRAPHTHLEEADVKRGLLRWVVVGHWGLLGEEDSTQPWATVRRIPRGVADPVDPGMAARRQEEEQEAPLQVQLAPLRLEPEVGRTLHTEAYQEVPRRERLRLGRTRSSRRKRLVGRHTCCLSFCSSNRLHRMCHSHCIESNVFRVSERKLPAILTHN